MPTIGSVSGTFGHGRSPQNAPQPGFTIYPAIGRTSTWTFAANGAFSFDANIISNTGNCFVITPTTTFIANIAVWGSGGGSANLTSVTTTNIAGAGGAVHGTFMFQGGQPYTVFAGAAGQGVTGLQNGGRGGASSGIFEGNIFQLALSDLPNPVLSPNVPAENQYQVTFNGTSQYLTTPSTANYNLSTGNWTVECWVYVTANGNNTILTSGVARSATHNYWEITPNRSLRWLTNPSGTWGWAHTYESTSGVIPNNSWVHIAAVRDGSNFSMYVDGGSVYSTNSFAAAGTSGTLFIGSYYGNVNGDGSVFRGSISNFRIVNGTAVYTNAFTTPTASLTAIANTVLLTCKSATFVDLSSNAVAITPVNSPVISVGGLALTSGLVPAPPATPSVYVAIASGGGGSSSSTTSVASTASLFRLAGAGGNDRYPQIGTVSAAQQGLASASLGLPGQGGAATGTPGQSGLPGSFSTWFSGGSLAGGSLGSGGSMRGTFESGGLALARPDESRQTKLQTVAGQYSIAALYDHSHRGLAGDSDCSGRVSIYLDQYQLTSIVATGGTVTTVPIPGYELAYQYHTFDTSGTFVVNSAAVTDTVDIFAVGGGGGGLDVLPVGSVGAGGGGGGVALRIGYKITAGTYNVDVGQGGAKSDQYAATAAAAIGRIQGAYRGGDSAFYTNALATKSFPDTYWRLLNSFGTEIRYISLAGDDSSGLTQSTAYTSFRSAMTKNASNDNLMVFAVIGGTYTPEIPAGEVQSPLIDGGKPRIFVCAPGKVNITFAPAQAASPRSSPMAALSHPRSAVYGATFIRTMFDSTFLTETAFFNSATTPSNYIAAGSFYNCVFRENSNFWGLVSGGSGSFQVRFRIENCTFFTKNSPQVVALFDASQVLIRNSVFNKAVTTNAVLDNTTTNQTVSSKYVVTGSDDKGVFSGPYSWGSAITKPVNTARTVMIMAQGGAGARYSQTTDYLTLEHVGGSGGGVVGWSSGSSPSTQYNRQLNQDYSSYGFPSIRGGGGGGAGYPGDSEAASPRGGIGIEWPLDSGTYYGTGGDTELESMVNLAPGNVGKGGNGSGANGSLAMPGNAGSVAIRYVVPGPYTPPALPRIAVNLIAYGGVITSTATYRQHVFTSSSRFVMLNRPKNMTIEILAVGGGGGSYTRYYSTDFGYGGRGGTPVYDTLSFDEDLQNDGRFPGNMLAVVVGAGGNSGARYWYDNNGDPGSASSVIGRSGINIVSSGGAGGTRGYYNGKAGVKLTQGLFSDNTQYWGADGGADGTNYYGGVPDGANWGGYGSGGRASGRSGIQGVVIIRYPIDGNTGLASIADPNNNIIVPDPGDTTTPGVEFVFRNAGFDYSVDGFSGTFPTLTLVRGQAYLFDLTNLTSSHPLALRLNDSNSGPVPGTEGNDPANGVAGNGSSTPAIVTYLVPMDAPDSIVYQCAVHSSMIGQINIVDSI